MSWSRPSSMALWLPLALFFGVGPVDRANDPEAVLVEMSGAVQVQRSPDASPQDAAVGLQLNVGDRVLVPEDGRAALLFSAGRVERITSDLTVEGAPGREPTGLFAQTVLTLQQVATTDARTQVNRQGMIRPIAGAPQPVAPRNAITLLEARPTLHWFGVPEAEEYMVQLRRVDDACEAEPEHRPQECRITRFNTGPDTAWTPPADYGLSPGATFEWTVGAMPGGRVAPDAQRFRLADSSDYELASGALRAIEGLGLDPAVDGLFLAALAFRDAGFYYEVERALRQMEAMDRGSGRYYFMLLGEVLDALGDLDAAASAFARADAEPGH